MSIRIHPYLYARLVAVQEAFSHPGIRPTLAANNTNSISSVKQSNNWQELLKKEDEDEEGDGGGGTIKGHRGKNAVNAVAAMRKLSRNR